MTARERGLRLGIRLLPPLDGVGERSAQPFGCAVTFTAEESALDDTALTSLIDSRLRIARAHLLAKAGIEVKP